MRPKTKFQGTMVVTSNGSEFVFMFPDGTCGVAMDKAEIETKAKVWFKKKTKRNPG